MTIESVAGKKVLITGAAMGMGRLYAERAVAELAAAVVLWDVNTAALNDTAAALKASGGTVFTYTVDLSQRAEIEHAAQQVRDDIGDIDILINNAGIVRGKYFWEHDNSADIWPTVAINSLAPMYVTRAFLPTMMANRRESRVVTMASAAGLVSNPRMSVYCGSKWAAVGWSDSLRLELEQVGAKQVRVTTVCPTYIKTGMFEGARGPLMTPLMTPEYVVERVWRAMKRGTPLVTLPWTVRLSMLLKGLLPLPVWDFVAGRIFGVYSSMKDFKGRGNP